MKYRIIEHRDGNGAAFYTVQVLRKFLWLQSWSTFKIYSPSGECSTYKMFESRDEARRFIKGQEWCQSVVEEGEI